MEEELSVRPTLAGNEKTAARRVLLLGLESRFGHDVIDTLNAAGIELIAAVLSKHDGENAGPYPLYRGSLTADDYGKEFLVPLLTPGRKKLRVEEARAAGLVDTAPVRHPSSVCSPSTSLGVGCILGPMVSVSSHTKIGDYFIANRNASVGHDCIIGNYCTIGPAAAVCGACVIEDGVHIGAGAVIYPKIKIGRNAVISAGSVVNRDVPSHTIVAGNPARVAKADVAGYRDIGV